MDKHLLVRRLYLTANWVTEENAVPQEDAMEQLDLFTDQAAIQVEKETTQTELAREKKLQEAMLGIRASMARTPS